MRGGSPSTVLAKSSARSPPQNSIVSIVRVTTKAEFTRNGHRLPPKACLMVTTPRASNGLRLGAPLRRAVRRRPRRHDRGDRAAGHPAGPRVRAGRSAVGAQRVHADLRRRAPARRAGGGSLRRPARVPERAAPLRRRLARLRAGADRRRADRRSRGAGSGGGAGGAVGARAARRHRARGRRPLARAGDLDRGGRRRRRVRLGARRPHHQRPRLGVGVRGQRPDRPRRRRAGRPRVALR